MYMILPAHTKTHTYPENARGSILTASTDDPDFPFMEGSKNVLESIPDTWKGYANTEGGRAGIVDMEYLELKKAKTPEEKQHELIHLASACLYYWRMLNV